jgi:hypothetical protein
MTVIRPPIWHCTDPSNLHIETAEAISFSRFWNKSVCGCSVPLTGGEPRSDRRLRDAIASRLNEISGKY